MRYSPSFNLLSIDPGSGFGICISHIDGMTGTMTVIDSISLTIDKAVKLNDDTRWARFTKQELIAFYLDDVLTPLLNEHSIDAVIFEAAFHAVSMVAYESLLFYGRTITSISKAYDWDILIESKTPSNVKKLNAVNGTSGDKDLMTKAVRANPRIIIPDHIVLDDLTEHAVDAIAIGYCVLHDLMEAIPPS